MRLSLSYTAALSTCSDACQTFSWSNTILLRQSPLPSDLNLLPDVKHITVKLLILTV